MNDSKKWIEWVFLVTFVAICLIGFFNYKVDSLSIFGNSNHVSRAAKSLTDGNMIAGLENFDERLLQELIVKNLEVRNSVIAVGSSKTMLLRKRFFLEDEINFFNHSVSGATLEDYISIVGLYELIYDYLPSTIILGIDPWVFNKNNGQTRWKTLEKYYSYQLNKMSDRWEDTSIKLDVNKWKQLINYDYTVSNVVFLANLLRNDGNEFYITKTIHVDDLVREVDGSINYPYIMRFPNQEKVRASALKHGKYPVYSLEDFNSLNNQKSFEKFVDYLQASQVEVIFFLPVYHPATYDLLINNPSYNIISEVEQYLVRLAAEKDISVKGSYNPHKFNLSNKDFLDGMHGDETVTKTIFLDGL
ncbi:hypothetical protein N9R52_01625 [Porticoccaceae bacterium]|nr:hypothetical protein [Porticoccaceae bacterium]